MKNFLDMSFEEFKKTIPWNKNYHCFEGLDNKQAIYLWGAEEAYHCLIESFSLFPSQSLCYAKDRISSISIFLPKEFEETFALQENAKYVDKFEEFSFDDVFDIAIEDVFNIFQFLKAYNHPKIKNGDIVLQHPSFEKDEMSHYKIVIGDDINAYNKEGPFLSKSIANPHHKDSVYLDEIFGILNLAEGYFLTLKDKSTKKSI